MINGYKLEEYEYEYENIRQAFILFKEYDATKRNDNQPN